MNIVGKVIFLIYLAVALVVLFFYFGSDMAEDASTETTQWMAIGFLFLTLVVFTMLVCGCREGKRGIYSSEPARYCCFSGNGSLDTKKLLDETFDAQPKEPGNIQEP